MSSIGDKTINELTLLSDFLESEFFAVENDFDTYRVSLALLRSLFYDPATGLLYTNKMPGIPLADLGTKTENFSVSLAISRMAKVVLNGATIHITFTGLLGTVGTVSTLTLYASQAVTLSWDEDIKWVDGTPLENMAEGDEYIVHISTSGDQQSDIVANFAQVYSVADDDDDSSS